jgi:microcystin-dependent protein
MGNRFLGELKIVSFNFAPQGWAMCNGQFLPINQNQALFALLGTNYGGNGQTTFALPDFRGRVPLHWGGSINGPGEAGGQEFHTVTQSEMPAHTHLVNGSTTTGTLNNGVGGFFGVSQTPIYAPPGSLLAIHPGSVTNVGGSQPHENRQPFLVLNIIICLIGIFPSQN